MATSKKPAAKTILDLTEAYDESRKKKYNKGKFLGKVTIATIIGWIIIPLVLIIFYLLFFFSFFM